MQIQDENREARQDGAPSFLRGTQGVLRKGQGNDTQASPLSVTTGLHGG